MRMRNRARLRNGGGIAALLSAAVATAAGAQGQSLGAVIEYPSPTSVQRMNDDAFRLDVGSAAGIEFHRVVAIRPLGSGGFVVANSGTSELYFFDGSGRRTSTAGRRGQGPGEFMGMRDMVLTRGDSILIFDANARRVSILGPDGAFARSIPLQPPFEGGGTPTRVAVLPDGVIVVGYSEIRQMAPQPEAVYFAQRLFEYSPAGSLRPGTGMSLPESEHFVQSVPPTMGGVAYWNLAFGRIMWIRADSSALLIGDGTDWTITVRGVDGSVRRRHRVARSVAPVSESDREGFRRAAVASAEPAQRAVAERMAGEMPFPRTKPAYRRFETDGAGRIWIESWPEPGRSETEWIRLDPARRVATALAFSNRFRPFAFTATMVYGVWRDADDVEHVRVYPLEVR